MQASLKMVKWGGVSLVLLAIAAVTVSVINILWFSYPLQANLLIHQAISIAYFDNPGLREVLTLGSFLPLLLIPGSLGVFYLFQKDEKPVALCAHYFAMTLMISWILADILWPSLNWYLSQYRYESAIPSDSLLIISGLNNLFFVYIGEYLRLLSAGIWIFLVSLAGYQTRKLPHWLSSFGMVIAILFWVSLLINLFFGNPWIIEHSLNYTPLLSLWMFLVGAVLISKANHIEIA